MIDLGLCCCLLVLPSRDRRETKRDRETQKKRHDHGDDEYLENSGLKYLPINGHDSYAEHGRLLF